MGSAGGPGRHSEKAADTIRPSAAGVSGYFKNPGEGWEPCHAHHRLSVDGDFRDCGGDSGNPERDHDIGGNDPSAVLGAVAGGMVIPFLRERFLRFRAEKNAV